MKKSGQTKARSLASLLFAAAVVLSAAVTFLSGLVSQPSQVGLVSDKQASVALSVAMSKIGSQYVWAARGPDTFDSSGIYIYAYRQAIPNIEFKISDGLLPKYAPDARHEDIYRWNFQEKPLQELTPGDLIYITNGSAEVTHGMMFVDWKREYSVMRVLDASSRLMRVGIQE